MNFINYIHLVLSSAVLLTFANCDEKQYCLSFRGCKKPPNRCAFCIEHACEYPYGNRYKKDKQFSCEPNDCQHLDCVPDNYYCFSEYKDGRNRGFPATCVCNEGFYGEKCDLKIDQGQSMLPGLSLNEREHFPGDSTPLTLRLFARNMRPFYSLVWTIDAEEGDGFLIERATGRCTEVSACTETKREQAPYLAMMDFDIRNRLPFKPYDGKDTSFLCTEDFIHGYMASIRVRVVDVKDATVNYEGTVNYDRRHPAFVDYVGDTSHTLRCIAVFELNNW